MGEFIHRSWNLYFANLTCQKIQFFGLQFSLLKWISFSPLLLLYSSLLFTYVKCEAFLVFYAIGIEPCPL